MITTLQKFNNINSKIFLRHISQKPVKILGEYRHFPPAVREWPDSIYSYNNNSMKHAINKRNYIDQIIKSYFNLYNKNNNIRSKRIRKLINSKSLNRLYISKPNIKHNSDKIIVNLFTYNKNFKSNIRNIYVNNSNLSFYNKWLNNHFTTMGNDYLSTKNNNFINNLYNKYYNKVTELKTINTKNLINSLSLYNKDKLKRRKLVNNIIYYKKGMLLNGNFKKFIKLQKISFKNYKSLSLLREKIKIKFPYNKIINEKNILLFRSTNLKNKNIKYINKLFVYYFLNCILHIFNIKTNILFSKNKKNIIITFINNKKLLYNSIIKKTDNNIYLDKINLIMWNLLKNMSININMINFDIKLYFLFKYFYFKYYSNIYIKLLKNNILKNIKYFLFSLNTYKYGKFLNYLKNIIYNIYNKKVDINIINIKYPQLNSDIISNIMTRKLKRKKGLYSIILAKTTVSSKLPLKVFYKEETNYLNNLENANFHRSLKVKNIKYNNVINLILKKIYPIEFINTNYKKIEYGNTKYTKNTGKISNVLNNIKYKWITGIRLETAGRLTRRFTAARSIYKFKYAGNLKNIDFATRNGITKPISTIMLRNYMKANSQNTFENSKKRIGAFNIKTWISSY